MGEQWLPAPTGPGWWWVKDADGQRSMMYLEQDGGCLCVLLAGLHHSHPVPIDCLNFRGFRWYGPIPEPPKGDVRND